MRRSQAGQATVEWSALLLALAFALAALTVVVARTDAWGLGERIVHALVCAVDGGCEERDSLDLAYGDELAEAVRAHAPNVVYERSSAALPIDFRRCRETGCSDGPDAARAIDRSRQRAARDGLHARGGPARRRRRALPPVLVLLPGELHRRHRPDLRRRMARLPSGRLGGLPGACLAGRQVAARATAHGEYASDWSDSGGWYRVSGGSHAGQLVEAAARRARHARRPSSTLVPLERLGGTGRYTFAVTPPWRKEVYTRPESASS